MPFFWQHGDHTEKLPEQIRLIYESGCRAFCVESRPHPDFAGEGWWRDMDIILAEAKKLGMKVWLLDDDKFPTGHAAGLIASKYPHLRQWNVAERHIDVVGPMKGGSVLSSATGPEHSLIAAYAYRRRYDHEEICEIDGIDLTANVSDGALYWDVPEGLWRIFFYYKTRQGVMKDYIDMTNSESVHALIEAVYETHYEHYKEYFGDTFAGFFSDEPCFGNDFRYGVCDVRAGKRGFRLPWNDGIVERMRARLNYDPISRLNLLWYEDGKNGDVQCEFRYAYMDAITELYSTCFNRQLGDWCRDHGVMYMGHIIEECSTSVGAGHFFRATRWQDMSGIDVVLHSVMPGMDSITHSSSGSLGYAKGDFSHYALAKLGASMAHIEPRMKGRAMCEVFGAYGWAEDTPLMKYLIDFLLVRGINHFVPHAFDSYFPDPDCPPHFGIEGKDPNFEGFSALMRYTNKAAHLLYGTQHVAHVALLYTAEGEWSGRFGEAMNIETAAIALYDAHVDFDIVPLDYLDSDRVKNGKLCLGDEEFECLVIPYTDHIAQDMSQKLKALRERGLELVFIDSLPENHSFDAECVPLDSLAQTMKEKGYGDVDFEDGHAHLRVYHCRRDGKDVFMFANEERRAVDTAVVLPCTGDFARISLANEEAFADRTDSGEVRISLEPSESQILMFGDCAGLKPADKLTACVEISPEFELELAEYDNMKVFTHAGSYKSFFNVTGRDFKPNFAGKMRYNFEIDVEPNGGRAVLDLGQVGSSAELEVNGEYMGTRFSAPYSFDVTNALKKGKNKITVTVGNTLAQKVRDRFSFNVLLPPSGLIGQIKLKFFE